MASERVEFKTIKTPSSGLFKDRGSKFLGFAFPFTSKDQLKTRLEDLKKEYHAARHFCYAYRINPSGIEERANDDGEPGHSAGTPILGQIQSKDLINVLVVVVRYFGGTKLGVPGLILAYKTAAKLALEQAQIQTQEIKERLHISFEYAELNNVMRVIKRMEPTIEHQNMQMNVEMVLSIRKDRVELLKEELILLKSLTFTNP